MLKDRELKELETKITELTTTFNQKYERRQFDRNGSVVPEIVSEINNDSSYEKIAELDRELDQRRRKLASAKIKRVRKEVQQSMKEPPKREGWETDEEYQKRTEERSKLPEDKDFQEILIALALSDLPPEEYYLHGQKCSYAEFEQATGRKHATYLNYITESDIQYSE